MDSNIPLSPACPINRRVLGWPRMSFCGSQDAILILSLSAIEFASARVGINDKQLIRKLRKNSSTCLELRRVWPSG